MSDAPTQRVIVVGAGLAGSLLASYLARAGHDVAVYERRPDPRVHGFAGGRSINLALSVRGITALERIGLAAPVLSDAVRMPGRMIHDRRGGTVFQPYSRDPADAIHSVSRGGLNIALIEAAAKHDSVRLFFGRRCVDVDLEAPAAVFEDEAGTRTRVDCDLLIAADGAFSAVRDAMLRRVTNFNYSQSFLAHGYKELHMPPVSGGGGVGGGGHAMEPHALHIWPRGGSMMIALPNRDGSFTCTLFWPHEGEHGFSALTSRESIVPFFEREYPDAVPLMPTLREDFERNPVGSLVTIRCDPWHWRGRVLILGDAAHAIVPFFGQGMNAAFEDVRLLDEALCGGARDRAAAFAEFCRLRKVDTDAIADMALDNFIEMRDKTASRAFRARKRLEHALHGALPTWFVPLYNMISFSNIPYAQARQRAARQWRWVIGCGIGLTTAVLAILGAAVALAR
jgi:kynurenine 3-monooxygenase